MSNDGEAQRVVIPYTPRKHFIGLHNSDKRFKFVVAHRRAGKSVSEINEIIKRALQNNRPHPHPRYAYIGPSFSQTKDLIWGYAKHYTSQIPGVQVSESDLKITLPNSATITLYGGAAAYERMRGLYFDGVVMDEFPLLNPNVFSTVVRPCIADYRGWAIISGTSNGDDHFHELKKKNENDPQWDFFIIPVTDTDALHPDEVVEMTKDMSPEEYAREMLCRFDAPVEGAYYAHLVNKAELEGRVTGVPHDPEAPVITWWDLGIDDCTAVWFVQRVGRELHCIDHFEASGVSLPDLVKMCYGTYVDPRTGCVPDKVAHRANYNFSAHVMPHDIRARELGTGKSRFEVFTSNVPSSHTTFVAPSLSVEDGITASRTVIPIMWFDKERTAEGLSALRNYRKNKQGNPVHNWASHSSDAFRIGSVSINQVMGYVSSAANNVVNIGGKLRRRIRGMC